MLTRPRTKARRATMGGKGGGLRAAYGIASRTILDSKNRAKSAGFMLLDIYIFERLDLEVILTRGGNS